MAKPRRVIKWNVPAEYHRFKARAEITEARRVLPRVLLRAGLPTYILSVVFLLWLMSQVPLEERKHILGAIWQLPLCVIMGLVLPLALLLYVNLYAAERVRLTDRGAVHGSNYYDWKQVTWYRFRDIDDFPHLRMLELSVAGRRGRERSRELAFDPSRTDERTTAKLMADVAPGKERLNW